MRPEPFVIGIDLGGTNVRVAGVLPKGGSGVNRARILASMDRPIEAAQGPQAGLEKIASLIEGVKAAVSGRPLAGIGIGSTGPINRERGAIQNPYTLPGWEDVDIVQALAGRFDVPVTLENDADAAALGESWVGAGQGMDRMAAVTVGTGIGVAFILNGQIYRGMDGIHGEAGHQVLDPHGPLCYCGAHGCWESLASGPAIALFAQERARQGSTQMIALAGGDLERITAVTVERAARMGDEAALAVLDQTAVYLGLGLVNLILFYLPEGIIFSGGVMRAFDLLEPGIRAVIARHNSMVPADRVKILLSSLGHQAGVFGAARAILNQIESRVS